MMRMTSLKDHFEEWTGESWRPGVQEDRVLQRSDDSGLGQGLEVVMRKWVQSGDNRSCLGQ